MALTKPRRTHETSGAMDSRSMTGPFFEVPFSCSHRDQVRLDVTSSRWIYCMDVAIEAESLNMSFMVSFEYLVNSA